MSSNSDPHRGGTTGHLPVGEHTEGYDDTESQPPPPPAIPELPDSATPDEKDEHWLTHVYQGDKQPQLTVRAVLMGGVLGMFMSISKIIYCIPKC